MLPPPRAPGTRDGAPSTRIPGYWLGEVLGQGATGIVYRATDELTGAPAAVKVLKLEHAANAQMVRRFIDEARALAVLRHPGIVEIRDLGALADQRPYLVMELCEGESLEEALRYQGSPTLERTLRLLDALLDALAASHRARIIHRDLKPANLLLTRNADGTETLKILDFGLARPTHRGRGVGPTVVGMVLGTPDFMAPEQISGDEVGPATDVYAAGSIAFLLLTNQLPFKAPSVRALISQKLVQPPPRACELEPTVPALLDALVARMMAIDPKARPSAAEARAQLNKLRISAELVGATNEGSSRPPELPDHGATLPPGTSSAPTGPIPTAPDDEQPTQLEIEAPQRSQSTRRR